MPSERPASGSEPARGGRDGSDGSDGRNGRGEPEKAPRGASRYPALRDPTRHRGGGHGARGVAAGRGGDAGGPVGGGGRGTADRREATARVLRDGEAGSPGAPGGRGRRPGGGHSDPRRGPGAGAAVGSGAPVARCPAGLLGGLR